MAILFILGTLLGIILGRFFKVFILAPGMLVAIALVQNEPSDSRPVAMLVVITSIQIGYVISLICYWVAARSGPRFKGQWFRVKT